MIIPLKKEYPITQLFGVNKENYSRFGLQGHNGIDYATPTGTDLIAPHSGEVKEVYFDKTGYGLYIKIENDKEGSVLAHLSEHYVSVGSKVMEGQLIGKTGNTGNSTGPHLHWGWYIFPRDRSNGFNGFQDQLVILKAQKIDYFPKPIDLSGKVNELEQKMKDLLATEERLKKEKEEIMKRYEESLKKQKEELINKIINLIRTI